MQSSAESVMPEMVTEMLNREGVEGSLDAAAAAYLYSELRQIAEGYFRHERSGHLLQPTALVHEAYLRLGDLHDIQWKSRRHFFAFSARVMRRVLVDHARRQARVKHGGHAQRVTLSGLDLELPADLEVIAVHDALSELADVDPDKARLVELRFFGGSSLEEIAELRGVSLSTVKRHWRLARAWLFERLAG